MSQTAAHLVDHVIPHVPVRQWVLPLPIPLRVLLASQPELVTPVLQFFDQLHRLAADTPHPRHGPELGPRIGPPNTAQTRSGSMPFRVAQDSLIWLMPRRKGWPADA
jgi:hypothetical protein